MDDADDLPRAEAYTRHEPWSLAPWLTGMIIAVVIFVVLIPAICSACFHYYYYKHGFDEEDLDWSDQDEDGDEESESDQDNFSLDERLDGSKKCRRKVHLCPCLGSNKDKEKIKIDSMQEDISPSSENLEPDSNLENQFSGCPLHCNQQKENITLDRRRRNADDNNCVESKTERENDRITKSNTISFEKIVAVIEAGQKRPKQVETNGQHYSAAPSYGRKNDYRARSLSMETFQSENTQSNSPMWKRPVMKKSKTDTWTPEGGTPLFSRPRTEEVTRCRFCAVPTESLHYPENHCPSSHSMTKIRQRADHNHDHDQSPFKDVNYLANNHNKRQFHQTTTVPCFKHRPQQTPSPPQRSLPLPPPPPPPVSPDISLLSFPSCNQHCQMVLQKKSRTIWHPRSGTTTVSFTNE